VVLLSEQGEFSESARIHRETLEVRRRVLGVEHPHTLGSSAGESSEAVRIHRETLEVRRRVLGAEHPDTLGSASNLAVVLSKQGGLSEAIRIHRETLEAAWAIAGTAWELEWSLAIVGKAQEAERGR
jgi:hypothetical protein